MSEKDIRSIVVATVMASPLDDVVVAAPLKLVLPMQVVLFVATVLTVVSVANAVRSNWGWVCEMVAES